MVKTSKHKNTQTGLFGKAWIKVTRSIICDLILSLFFLSLNIVPLIGSDCPSQSRDAILVAMETSSASAGRRADNVAAPFLRGCHSNAGWTRAHNERKLYWEIPRWLQGSRIQIWLNVFKSFLIKLFSSYAMKRKLTGALVFLMPDKYLHFI